MASANHLLRVEDLHVEFHTHSGVIQAVRGVDLTIEPGEKVGLVGESGCGKSVTALAILRLVPRPRGHISQGHIWIYRDHSVTDVTELGCRSPEMRSIRGKEMAMVFQEPMTSLNPSYTIGYQIMEAIQLHQNVFLHRIEHLTVDYDRKRYCGHPRQCGMKNLGNGELAVLYWRAPCNYETDRDISHSQADGYQSRASAILRRSLDHGQTWRPADDVVVWEESRPVAERMRFLGQDPAQRQILDMSAPTALYFFGRTTIVRPDPTTHEQTLYAPVFLIRSVDKGHTWQRVPVTIAPPPGMTSMLKDNHPLATLPDGAVVGAFTAGQPGSVWLYGSENHGMTWQCLSRVAVDRAGAGRPTYANLILLPSGRLQCYMLMLAGGFHALCLSESDDCFTWSEPRPIVRYGHGPWVTRWQAGAHRGVLYRSPWPLRLRDGRILVVFARREFPAGIATILSEDDGKSWSDAVIVRDDASGPDLGYPVATELDDGRIFTAYYYQLQDGNGFHGTRFIGGSFFALR